MYVEVLDHARHDGGGLGRAIGFSRQDSVSQSRHALVRSHADCLLTEIIISDYNFKNFRKIPLKFQVGTGESESS